MRAQVLLQDNTGRVAAFAITDGEGKFRIICPDTGPYLQIVQYIGYKSDSTTITCDITSSNAAPIILQTISTTLSEALLTAKKTLYEQRGDTLVYDTKGLETTHGRSAGDLLDQLPGLAYDEDEGLKFQGRSVSKVLVDGDDGLSSSSGTVLRSLKGMDIAEVKAYEGRDTSSAASNTELTVDLILTEKARARLRGDADLGANLNDYLLEASTYRIGSSKFLAYAFTSNAQSIPFSIASYASKSIPSPRQKNYISTPALFFNRGVAEVNNSAFELSGIAKKGAVSMKGFGALYLANDSVLSQRVTRSDDFSVRSDAAVANQVQDLRGHVVLKSPLGKHLRLTATAGVTSTTESNTSRFLTSSTAGAIGSSSTQAQQFAATRHTLVEQYTEIDYRRQARHRLSFIGALTYSEGTDSLRLVADEQLPGSASRAAARYLSHRQLGYGFDLINMLQAGPKWRYETSVRADAEPLRIQLNEQQVEHYKQYYAHLRQEITYSLGRHELTGQLGIAHVNTQLSPQRRSWQPIGKLAAVLRFANASKLNLSLERSITQIRSTNPQRDTLRLDVQRFITPYLQAPPTAATYNFDVSLQQQLPSGRGMRYLSGMMRYGSRYGEFTDFQADALYLQPIQFDKYTQVGAMASQFLRFNKFRLSTTLNSVFTSYGTADDFALAPLDNLLLQLLAKLDYKFSADFNISLSLKPDVVAINRSSWTSNETYTFEIRHSHERWRFDASPQVLIQTNNSHTQAIPNLSGQVRYAFNSSNSYWLGAQLGYGLRGSQSVERLLPVTTINAVTERQQQILPQYALVKVGFSW